MVAMSRFTSKSKLLSAEAALREYQTDSSDGGAISTEKVRDKEYEPCVKKANEESMGQGKTNEESVEDTNRRA